MVLVVDDEDGVVVVVVVVGGGGGTGRKSMRSRAAFGVPPAALGEPGS